MILNRQPKAIPMSVTAQAPARTPLASPKYSERAAAIAHFTHLRCAAEAILRRAANISGLPDLHRQQGLAAAKLAGMRLHRIQGEAGADDFAALSDDLTTLWEAVDPLIDAVGAEAAAGSAEIDRDLFRDQLRGALEGNATYALQRAAEDGCEPLDPMRGVEFPFAENH